MIIIQVHWQVLVLVNSSDRDVTPSQSVASGRCCPGSTFKMAHHTFLNMLYVMTYVQLYHMAYIYIPNFLSTIQVEQSIFISLVFLSRQLQASAGPLLRQDRI